jgi:hypothetical protein
VATPFVQGRLLEKDLSCAINTECAISKRAICMEIDSELRYHVRTEGARPVFFVPLLDLPNLDAPCIVEDF